MDKKDSKELIRQFFKKPAVVESFDTGRVRFDLYDDNSTAYVLDGRRITRFFALASVKDGRKIDTRTAERKSVTHTVDGGVHTLDIVFEERGLRLTQHLTVRPGEGWFTALGILRDLEAPVTVSNFIAPLDFAYPNADAEPLFLSLEQRMLLVPYDNDMWTWYESALLKPGRASYDVTAIYDENTNRGLVVGALDFDVWKNAIRCSSFDARCVTAFSGAADAGTHDVNPHGYLDGETVSSARFVCGWHEDVRGGLEEYGRLAMEGKYKAPWSGPAPFGWNSYSAGCSTIEQWREAGIFIRDELPAFRDDAGSAYINLDFNILLDPERMRRTVDELHSFGFKAGNYTAPLLGHTGPIGELMPLRDGGEAISTILMRDENGEPYHKFDSGCPVDITLPAAERNLRAILREYVSMGFDYIKIDFVSHGGLEGPRFDKSVKTGRQALARFYDIVRDELSVERTGREIFVDLSIAPLFPAGYAQARRCCCDSFGHHEDVRYVLNALNYGWWQSGTLYRFADPDHTVLYRSKIDGRGVTDVESAKSRYLASVISGTVMLLSDDFGPTGDTDECRARVKAIANNERLNEVARIGRAFRPAWLRGETANAYYLRDGERLLVALFNFDDKERRVSVAHGLVEAPAEGRFTDLVTGAEGRYSDDIAVSLPPYGSALLEIG